MSGFKKTNIFCLFCFFLQYMVTSFWLSVVVQQVKCIWGCSSSINGCDHHTLLFLAESKIWRKFCLYFEHFLLLQIVTLMQGAVLQENTANKVLLFIFWVWLYYSLFVENLCHFPFLWQFSEYVDEMQKMFLVLTFKHFKRYWFDWKKRKKHMQAYWTFCKWKNDAAQSTWYTDKLHVFFALPHFHLYW